MTISKISGEEFLQLRLERGLTQTAFAELIGTSQQSIGSWERGGVPLRRVALVRSALWPDDEAQSAPTPTEDALKSAPTRLIYLEMAQRLPTHILLAELARRIPE